ncbi:hypothetical protein Zmor_009031 [Zophobas morio]|uniref:Uncharacterized protein n=1 Tax=Zophobas morio TaxID=2755281 RepID=A0AA38HJZ5_9CUCU|nr:hypothetical protein Zmor_009031 [Zophobas morio]
MKRYLLSLTNYGVRAFKVCSSRNQLRSQRPNCRRRLMHARHLTLLLARAHTKDAVDEKRTKRPLPLVLVHIPRPDRQKLLKLKTVSIFRLR